MIQIDYKDNCFVLSFDYIYASKQTAEGLKTVQELPVRTWQKKLKRWEVPLLAVKSLEGIEAEWTPEALQWQEKVNKALLFLIDCKFNPGEEHTQLRPYQTVGVRFLAAAKKAILADDMRLGKTIQSIYAVLENNCAKVLILCPANVKWNWYQEFQKHFEIEALVIEGNAEQRKILWDSDNQFKIANYDLLIRDWNVMPKEWDAIIADECVYLKTHSSQRTKLAKKLKANMKIGLSGFPMERNLLEFHSICEWVRPEVIPNFYRFKYRYCVFDWNGAIIGYKNLEELHLLTSPYILRRTRKEVRPELPDKIYTEVPLEFGSKQRQAYNAIKGEYLTWLADQTGNDWQEGALEKQLRLRQFVEFPSLVGFDLSSGKLEWLEELYEMVDKIVVFTFFRESAKLIRDRFNTKYFIAGGVPSKDRFSLTEEYNKATRGILVATDAGRFGTDLSGADTIVHFGCEHNPATMRQREDRLIEYGQPEAVQVLTPMFRYSIDEGIYKRFIERERDAKEFMDGSNTMSLSRLSKEDFKRMVEGG